MKYVYLLICIGISFFAITKRNYKKEFLKNVNRKKNTLYFLYPMIAYILDRIHFFDKKRVKEKQRKFAALFPVQDSVRSFYCHIYQKVAIMVLIIAFTCFLCVLVRCREFPSTGFDDLKLKRPTYGEESKYIDLDVMIEGEHSSVKQNVQIEIKPRQFTDEEIKLLMEESKETLAKEILAENISLARVGTSLNLISNIPGSPINVTWTSSPDGYIDQEGNLNNKGIIKPVQISLCASLSYNDIQKDHIFDVCVTPYAWTWGDKVQYDFKQELNEEDETSSCSSYYKLPEKIGNAEVKYNLHNEDKTIGIIALGVLMTIAILVLYEEKIKRAEIQRERQMMLDYPELVNKLTLLIGAGMTVKKSWNKIITDYYTLTEKNHGTLRYVYEEMIITWNEIENGVSETVAFEHFGQRIKIKSYLRLVSLLTQNMRKGSKGMLELLNLETREAMEERKQIAKKLGEEAGTKLLIPMIGMLVIILVIVMVPAFLSMS